MSTGFNYAIEDIIAPDTLLPSQFADLIRSSRDLKPEQRLVYAVFESAISDYNFFRDIHTSRARKYFLDAKEYLFSDSDYPYSARWCCDHLGEGFDLEAVRARLLAGDVAPLRRRDQVRQVSYMTIARTR